jgi:hypothetical protein
MSRFRLPGMASVVCGSPLDFSVPLPPAPVSQP